MNFYILDNRKPVRIEHMDAWMAWMDNSDRRVASTKMGDVRVSTVFLGIDHYWEAAEGTLALFETMVFGGMLDGNVERSSTWEDAEAVHEEMCEAVKSLEEIAK